MSKSSSIYLYAGVAGDNLIENYGSLTIATTVITPSLSQRILLPITVGNTTITLSPSNVYIDIVPPASSQVTKYILFGGDTTGVQINDALPSRISLQGTQTYMLVRCGNSFEVLEIYLY